MLFRTLGDPPFVPSADGQLRSRVATFFLGEPPTLYLSPYPHIQQRLDYAEWLNQDRAAKQQPPLTDEETEELWTNAVDLIVTPDRILIRPDPQHLDLAFRADDLLQSAYSKRRIRFLHLTNPLVKQAIKTRGEYWRISPLPTSAAQMCAMIEQAKVRVNGPAFYYYNMFSGTRYLTLTEFRRLATLPVAALAAQLAEIQRLCTSRNRFQNLEADWFGAGEGVAQRALTGPDFTALTEAALRAEYEALDARFAAAVPPALHVDNPADLDWRNLMHRRLIMPRNEELPEPLLQGLSAEFYMQIEWLPGARIADGELLLDPVFAELEATPSNPELQALCDERVTGFIFNFITEVGDLEYVNVGRVCHSLGRRRKNGNGGARRVYIAEFKQRNADRPTVRILRLQKYGIVYHLDEDRQDLLTAIMVSEEYTQYILDRRLGCRQLGMNLPLRLSTRKIWEKYDGPRQEYRGTSIWTVYFDRDYVVGMATDKVPLARFRDAAYALVFARYLGRAAAGNLIVGRCTDRGEAFFDDGDEVVIHDEAGNILDVVVADITGSFVNYMSDLKDFAEQYAQPLNRRLAEVPCREAFVAAYLEEFEQQFVHMQDEYRQHRTAFDTLFKLRKRDVMGSFAFRWERVLHRLDHTDAAALTAAIRQHVQL